MPRIPWVAALCLLAAGATLLAADGTGGNAGDWPQLAGGAQRTGYTPQGVAPPYRARWIWCGPDKVLRNKNSNPAWGDDLSKGKDYPLVMKTGFTFSGQVQPVIAGGKVYVGDMEGRVYAISAEDGSTVWVGENPGGTAGSAAVAGSTVVVTAIPGAVTGLNAQNGKQAWRVELPKAVTGSPLVIGNRVFTGCHDGKVYAIDADSGKVLWATDLGAPIVADLCGDEKAVYVGAENMYFHKLDSGDGRLLAKTRMMGQSFRMLHPVLYKDLLFVQTVQAFCVGSEYAMEELMKDPADTDIAAEQKLILRWLAGDTNGGKWKDAEGNPAAWKHLHVLKASDLSEPFVVPNGPADGCGTPCPAPCVDNEGRVLTWFKTKFPTLTAKGSFGTNFSMDISAIDLQTGARLPIDKGHLSGRTGETDNLFAMSCGGPYLYLRQRFRGTWGIDLGKAQTLGIQSTITSQPGYNDVEYRAHDVSDENYSRTMPRANQASLSGRAAPAVGEGLLLLAEDYCITAIEHRDQ